MWWASCCFNCQQHKSIWGTFLLRPHLLLWGWFIGCSGLKKLVKEKHDWPLWMFGPYLFSFYPDYYLKSEYLSSCEKIFVLLWVFLLHIGKVWPDMQKYNFFTQTQFKPNIFYPKKWVNYIKSNLRQNNVKGPKDQNSAKKCQKVT